MPTSLGGMLNTIIKCIECNTNYTNGVYTKPALTLQEAGEDFTEKEAF